MLISVMITVEELIHFQNQRDNLKIIYVNGEEIEDWLFENPDIESTYFASRSAQKQKF